MEQMERQTSADFLSHGCAGARAHSRSSFPFPPRSPYPRGQNRKVAGGPKFVIQTVFFILHRYGFVITQHFLAQTNSNCSKVKEWKLRPKPRTFVGTFAFAPFHSSRKIRLSASQPDPLLQSATCSLFFRSLASLHNIVLKQKTHKWNINRLHIPLSGAIQK